MGCPRASRPAPMATEAVAAAGPDAAAGCWPAGPAARRAVGPARRPRPPTRGPLPPDAPRCWRAETHRAAAAPTHGPGRTSGPPVRAPVGPAGAPGPAAVPAAD